ncbi:GNAT family N-acetyltransferase [Lachnoanaerobaculum saburreum]|uniref:GNAT family N-acetyltransferase n=1 Tax=Lachnoanaerobaculum saburreum TaxID=467210 RepID=UPI0002FC64DC|nr:GNAT family protein [Lachnoanaerobaculum saburreum]
MDNIIIKEASSEDALARIEYSKKIGAETDNLSFGAECFPISVEGEAEYIESLEIINLEVKSDNFRAIHVYEKFGFRKIGTSPAYFKIGDSYIDFDIMYLDLR